MLRPIGSFIGAVVRVVRAILRPLTRLAFLALVWMNRNAIGLWYRSLRAEIEHHGVDLVRQRQLIRGLWIVSNEQHLANSAQLRSIGLAADGFVVEASADWPARSEVEELLAPVPPFETTVTAA